MRYNTSQDRDFANSIVLEVPKADENTAGNYTIDLIYLDDKGNETELDFGINYVYDNFTDMYNNNNIDDNSEFMSRSHSYAINTKHTIITKTSDGTKQISLSDKDINDLDIKLGLRRFYKLY